MECNTAMTLINAKKDDIIYMDEANMEDFKEMLYQVLPPKL